MNGTAAADDQLDGWAERIDRITGASIQACAIELAEMIHRAEDAFARMARATAALEQRIDSLEAEVRTLATAGARLLDSHTYLRSAADSVKAAASAMKPSAPISVVHNADVLPASASAP